MQHKVIIAAVALLGLYLYTRGNAAPVEAAKVAPAVPKSLTPDTHVVNVAPVAVPAFAVTSNVDSYSPYFGKTAAEMEVIRQANIAALDAGGLFSGVQG